MKFRKGFVSNSSSSSFIIDATMFKSVVDIGEYMLRKCIHDILSEYEDRDIDEYEMQSLKRYRGCLANILNLKSHMESISGGELKESHSYYYAIAFQSVNYNTFIKKIVVNDKDYYYVSTCNNIDWGLSIYASRTNIGVDEYELRDFFINGQTFFDILTMKDFVVDNYCLCEFPKLSECQNDCNDCKCEIIEEEDESFLSELKTLINKYSMENCSDTPDFVLANYVENCLTAFNNAVVEREKWYGREIRFATEIDSHCKKEIK